VTRTKWVWLFTGLVAAGLLAVALWYARERGWLGIAQTKEEQGHGSMSMDMGGSDDDESEISGYSAVTIEPGLQQRIGVTVEEVTKQPLEMSVRTVGIVRPNETKMARIHLRTEGWVEELFVNFTGQEIQKGDPLLSIYSPEFLTTQQDYLTARKAERTTERRDTQSSLASGALRRLQLWRVPREEIDELERSGKPRETLTLRSPISGTVLKKDVIEGDYITAEQELYVLADLSNVWVQAKIYEYELPHVELEQPATVTLPSLPDREFSGKVVFVQPVVEQEARTIQVRIELPNEDRLLKPDMFANVEIAHSMGEGLLVPTSAVILTGERNLAYRVEPKNRFVPLEVTISHFKFGDHFHVLEGLHAGDKVVTSANFLIDSESRLRFGGGSMAAMPGMKMDEMKGMKMDEMEGMDHSKMKH